MHEIEALLTANLRTIYFPTAIRIYSQIHLAMKKLIGLVLVSTLLTGCMHTTCPTYGQHGRRSGGNTVLAKKAMPGQTPYYKTMKLAEQD